jgi:hypothetical protein
LIFVTEFNMIHLWHVNRARKKRKSRFACNLHLSLR